MYQQLSLSQTLRHTFLNCCTYHGIGMIALLSGSSKKNWQTNYNAIAMIDKRNALNPQFEFMECVWLPKNTKYQIPITNTKYKKCQIRTKYQILRIDWVCGCPKNTNTTPQCPRTGCPLTYIIIFPQFIFVIIVIVVNLATVTLWDMLDTLLSKASN